MIVVINVACLPGAALSFTFKLRQIMSQAERSWRPAPYQIRLMSAAPIAPPPGY